MQKAERLWVASKREKYVCCSKWRQNGRLLTSTLTYSRSHSYSVSSLSQSATRASEHTAKFPGSEQKPWHLLLLFVRLSGGRQGGEVPEDGGLAGHVYEGSGGQGGPFSGSVGARHRPSRPPPMVTVWDLTQLQVGLFYPSTYNGSR